MNTIIDIISTPFNLLVDAIDCFEDCIIKFSITAIPTILATGFVAGWLI